MHTDPIVFQTEISLTIILSRFHDKQTDENVNTNSSQWKFHDFSITQILREINFGDSRSAKSGILTHSEALNFDSYVFLHFLKAEVDQIT